MTETKGRFDISLLDAFLFDDVTSGTPPPPVVVDEITFNDYGLQNSDVFTSMLSYSGTDRDLVKRAFPRAHGQYVEVDQWRQNTILLAGTVRKATRALLEAEMDNMRKNFAVADGVLKILFAGENRYFDCYATGLERLFADRQAYHVTFCPWEIELICLHPFARSLTRESFAGGNATAASTNFEITESGTAPTESIVSLVLSTAGTVEKLSWENTETGEKIIIDNGAAFSNGDTLTINGETKQVLKNGTPMDFDGVFPSLNAGINTCTLEIITGSGHTIAVNEQHYKRYY
jgi:hypothetical protein